MSTSNETPKFCKRVKTLLEIVSTMGNIVAKLEDDPEFNNQAISPTPTPTPTSSDRPQNHLLPGYWNHDKDTPERKDSFSYNNSGSDETSKSSRQDINVSTPRRIWWDEVSEIEDKVDYTLQVLSKHSFDLTKNPLSKDLELSCLLNEKCRVERLIGPPVIRDKRLVWSGANAVTMMNMIVDNVNPGESIRSSAENYLNTFRGGNTLYKLTLPEAVPPQRGNVTDAGFDLTLVKLIKSEGGVDYFTTGVILEPPSKMWYMLVPRSSMAKSGYTLANGVGIIDSGYRGEIIVALRKVNPDTPAVSLPAKWVQVIPQQWYNVKMINSADLVSHTVRGDNGGLGSAQFKDSTKQDALKRDDKHKVEVDKE